jgi:acetyl esterase/lipase
MPGHAVEPSRERERPMAGEDTAILFLHGGGYSVGSAADALQRAGEFLRARLAGGEQASHAREGA